MSKATLERRNYREQDIDCCENCKHCKSWIFRICEEPEAYREWQKLSASDQLDQVPYINPLGICDKHERKQK